jgi:hypothetical protein
MKIRLLLSATAIAVLAPAAAFASTATPNPVAPGNSVLIEWTNTGTTMCSDYWNSWNADPNPASFYGTGIKWPDGTYTQVAFPSTNPTTVVVPASMIPGTALVFLGKDPGSSPPESGAPAECSFNFEVVAALPSPMMSTASLAVGAVVAASVGVGLTATRRRRFARAMAT